MNNHSPRAESRAKTLPVTYVALLRAVNVGGKNKVEMVKLKRTFERLGFDDVQTFIASGNIIFRTEHVDQPLLVREIESAIESDFRVRIKILLRDLKAMSKLVKSIPDAWVNDEDTKCDVMFLDGPVDHKRVLEQLPFDPALEDVKYVPGAVIWRIDRARATKSRMFKIVGTPLHQSMTVRNPNTVRKLYALMLEHDSR